MRSLLEGGGLDASLLLNSIAPLLTREDVGGIAEALRGNRRFRRDLIQTLAEDPYVWPGLTDLISWKRDPIAFARDATNTRRCDEKFNYFGRIGYSNRLQSLGHALVSTIRRDVVPRRKLCVLATARNEGPYLLEWIAHHKVLGVEQFFIYSNDNDDHSDGLLKALAEAGEIVWIDNEVDIGNAAQIKAYAHAFNILPDILDFEWCAVIDLDEFIYTREFKSNNIIEFCEWYSDCDTNAIGLNWEMIAPSIDPLWRDENLGTRCKQSVSADGGNRHVKCIVRPRFFLGSTPHFPLIDQRSSLVLRDGTRSRLVPAADLLGTGLESAMTFKTKTQFAAIKHYYFKSAEEALWKFSRNRGDHNKISSEDVSEITDNFVKAFFAHVHNADPAIEPGSTWAGSVNLEIERLLALPGVSQARVEIVRTFKERLAHVKAVLRASASLEDGSDRHRLYELAGVFSPTRDPAA